MAVRIKVVKLRRDGTTAASVHDRPLGPQGDWLSVDCRGFADGSVEAIVVVPAPAAKSRAIAPPRAKRKPGATRKGKR